MPLTRIRELQRNWFGSHSDPSQFSLSLEAAFDKIGFTDKFVNEAIKKYHPSGSTKVIKDNVWGMIELDESAIRLLDCPIIQRLRRIRQLGFSYLIYPSAEHSRFVHSLGMLGVIARFLDSASRSHKLPHPSAGSFQAHDPSPSDRLDLLHAALLHDTGHLPFSHASEFALEALKEFIKVGQLPLENFFDAALDAGVRKLKLAELLSVAIVLSPRFGRYYKKYVRGTELIAMAEDSPLRVASLILGQPTDSVNIGYAELISGHVIDADKLDYVSRDGLACGIPTGIDVGRLFLRSEFLKFGKDELNRLRRRFGYNDVGNDQVQFIVNSSGRDTIEELISARTSLYHRVYFHQTTRNTERLFEKLIEAAATSLEEAHHLDCLNIWSSSDEQFLGKLVASSNEDIKSLAIRISSRQLPKRAVVFGQNELSPLFPLKSAASYQYDEGPLRLPHLKDFSKKSLYGSALTGLEYEVEKETNKLFNLIRNDLDHDSPLLKATGSPLIVISPAQFSPAVHDDCLVLQNRELVYSKELHNVTQTNDAEEIFRASGYVLTDDPWREIVFIAARTLLAQRTAEWLKIEVRVDERNHLFSEASTSATVKPEIFTADAFTTLNLDQEKVAGRTGIQRQKLQQIEHLAERRGYFDSFPFLTSKPEIPWERLSSKFYGFEGQYGWKISKELAEAFIWQFPPGLRQDAISLLEQIELLDNIASSKLIRISLEKFAKNKPSSKICIAPLTPNSGNEVRIALEARFRSSEDFKKNFEIYHSLEELLHKQQRNDFFVALIDDNVISGSQAFAQLASWMGVSRSLWPSEIASEKNIDDRPLSSSMREKFLNRLSYGAVGICVAIGSQRKSKDNLAAFCRLVETSSNATDEGAAGLFPDTPPFEIPLFAERNIESQNPGIIVSNKFEKFVSAVGADLYALIKYNREFAQLTPAEKSTCNANSLGYDNAKGLTITFRNVPVSTLTCLWCPGRYQGRPWLPLAIRRGYGKQVVVA
jgi:HD superfamily phosphohydrolase